MTMLYPYTDKQIAVLRAVARSSVKSGKCSVGHNGLAKLAGVGRTTVREALRLAEERGDIRVSRRLSDGETNVIYINVNEWLG